MSQTRICDLCERTERDAGTLAEATLRLEGQTLSLHICRSCAVRLPGFTVPASETAVP